MPTHDCTPRTVRGHDEWGPTTTTVVPRCDRGLNSHRDEPEPMDCPTCGGFLGACECGVDRV